MKKVLLTSFGLIALFLVSGLVYFLIVDTSTEIVENDVVEEMTPEPILEDSPAVDTYIVVEEDVEQPDQIVESNASKLHTCSQSPFSGTFCYTVEPGDTLWGIADRYLFSGFRWERLHDGLPNGGYTINYETFEWTYISDFDNPPFQLKPGMEIGMRDFFMLPPELEIAPRTYHVQGSALSPYNDDVLMIINRYGSNRKMVYLNEERYHDTYGHYSHLRFSDDGEHISFVAQKAWSECVFIMDKVEHNYPCGNDVQDPLLNEAENHYAFRVNRRDTGDFMDADEFAIISDLGNGPYYDYVDSLMWVDDETFVYRAQKDNQWRIVINHEDQGISKYVDFLTVEDGVVTYSTEHEDGTWTDERIEF